MTINKKNILIVGGILFCIGLITSYVFRSDKFFVRLNVECSQKANVFFKKMNIEVNPKLDYSFAENDSALTLILGNGYRFVSSKDNNCYAVVKNYNPRINEYRYSILNIDTEELNPVLLDHDLYSSSSVSYKQDFIIRYNQLFIIK